MGMAFPIRAASPGDIFDAEEELVSSTGVEFFSLFSPLEQEEEELSFMASIRAASPEDTRGESPPLASAMLPPSLSLRPPPEVVIPGAGGGDEPGGPPKGLGGKAEDFPLPLLLPLRAAILSAMLEPPLLLEGSVNRATYDTMVRMDIWMKSSWVSGGRATRGQQSGSKMAA